MHLTDRCTVLKPTAVDRVIKSPITVTNLLKTFRIGTKAHSDVKSFVSMNLNLGLSIIAMTCKRTLSAPLPMCRLGASKSIPSVL